jgi:maltose phosphorylase
MNQSFQTDPWCIIEEGFQPNKSLENERIFGIGNGYMGNRAHFEEFYSGDTEIRSYVTGVNKYFEQKDENAEVLSYSDQFSNLPNWLSLNVRLNAEMLDLTCCEVVSFRRILNMQHGYLERTFEVITAGGHHIEVSVQRFLSQAQPEVGAIKYVLKSLNFEGRVAFVPVIDGDFNAVSALEEEPQWNVLQSRTQQNVAHLWVQTRRTNFQVCAAMAYELFKNNAVVKSNPTKIEKQKVAGFSVGSDVKVGDTICIYKYFAVLSSLNHNYKELTANACELVLKAKQSGWNSLFGEHRLAWTRKWESSEVDMSENSEALQAKRYKLFQQNRPSTSNVLPNEVWF